MTPEQVRYAVVVSLSLDCQAWMADHASETRGSTGDEALDELERLGLVEVTEDQYNTAPAGMALGVAILLGLERWT